LGLRNGSESVQGGNRIKSSRFSEDRHSPKNQIPRGAKAMPIVCHKDRGKKSGLDGKFIDDV